jgi:hypothetical protein
MVEFKNLVAQLQPTFTRPVGSPNFTYQGLSRSIFGDMYNTSNASKLFQKPFPPDSWITVGLKGRVCSNCLNTIYIPVFLKIDGKNEMFEPQHECLEQALYSIEEKEEVLKTSNTNLTKQMSIIIKAWLLGENCIIEAKEIDAHTPIIGEIKTNQKDHWSARAIKDNLTELRDDNELVDFLAKNNNSTFGVFKVYLNQQSSSKFYRFMIIKRSGGFFKKGR